MIDIRSHILDGTPCGPGSFAESLEMCRAAISDGVKTLVATPRWEAGSAEPPLPFEECCRKMERLEAEMRGALSFRLGFALQFSAMLPELVARYGPKLALAGKRHLLISLPSVEIPEEVEDVWKALAGGGFSIVLAHPECNTVLRRDAARLARWVSEGLKLQVDAASVSGIHGREVQRFAVNCIRTYEGYVVVASNSHANDYVKTSLGKYHKELVSKLGLRQLTMLMREVPMRIIGDNLVKNDHRQSSVSGLAYLLRFLNQSKGTAGNANRVNQLN